VPAFLDRAEFYLALDPDDLLQRLRAELRYLSRHWTLPGRPTLVLWVPRDLLQHGEAELLRFVREAAAGVVDGVPVVLGPLSRLALSANEERIDDLDDWRPAERPLDDAQRRGRVALTPTGPNVPLSPEEELAIELTADTDALSARLRASTNAYEQAELLTELSERQGTDAVLWRGDDGPVTVAALLSELYDRAGDLRLWGVVRLGAALLEMVEPTLSDAAADLLAAQKRLLVGKAYADEATVDRPLPQAELLGLIRRFCREDVRDRVLTQELIVALAGLLREDPERFEGIRTLRLGHLTLLLASELAHEADVPQDEGYERLASLPPSEVRRRLRRLLHGDERRFDRLLERQERLAARLPSGAAPWESVTTVGDDGPAAPPAAGWWRWRQREGALARLPDGFARRAWDLLRRCDGLVIGDKLERRNRLDSRRITGESTAGELNFALRVEHLLHKIPSPEYRQVTVEAILELSRLFAASPDLRVRGSLVMDVVVGHAVRRAWLGAGHDVAAYERDKAAAWAAFYDLPPVATREAVRSAFASLLETGEAAD